MPRPPQYKYLDSNPNEIIFSNYAIRIIKGKLLLSLSKEVKSKYNVKNLKFEMPSALQSIIDLDNLQQIRIKRDNLSDSWYLLVIYKIEPKNKAKGNNIMAIDLGLNNLATLTFKDNTDNYIINGRPIKSKNSYFNKETSRLQSIRMKQTGSKKFRNTKKIKQLRIKRKNYIINYFHQASRKKLI